MTAFECEECGCLLPAVSFPVAAADSDTIYRECRDDLADIDSENPHPSGHYPDEREKILVRFTPRALHELWVEVKDLSVEQRQMGHRTGCDFVASRSTWTGRSRTTVANQATNAVGESTLTRRSGSPTTYE